MYFFRLNWSIALDKESNMSMSALSFLQDAQAMRSKYITFCQIWI